MSGFQIAWRSFLHYLRTHIVLALGVAAATAVLTGALIVGDSMRNSLQDLALDRLGKVDEMIVADGFFRAELANELKETEAFQSGYELAEPAILFPNGSVESRTRNSTGEPDLSRVSKVNVFGVTKDFWNFADGLGDVPAIENSQVIINQALADSLGLSDLSESTDPGSQARLTLRIPKPTQLPSDSALGNKEGLIESLVDLQVAAVVPNRSIARFGMHVSQFDSPNIFVPFAVIEESLRRSALSYKNEPQTNVIFLSRLDGYSGPAADVLSALSPSLADFGLSIKEVRQQAANSDADVFHYYSLASDRLVLADSIVETVRNSIPAAVEVFTYLANDIRKESQPTGIPFSMVSALEFGSHFELRDNEDNPIPQLEANQIVLNEWTAEDLDASVGDEVALAYFEPESTHGSQEELTAKFTVAAIAKLAEPDTSFQVRRNKVTPPQFLSESPSLANDPDLTPEVPGLTDAASIEQWDLPFETADRIRPEDDDYWNLYRTTPKAFVSPARAREMWSSRFGQVTSFRIPASAGTKDEVEERILNELRSSELPLVFKSVAIRKQAVEASSGSTPFDALFLALSMFVIASALILVALLFRLALQHRVNELGVMLAAGVSRRQVSRILLTEMLVVTLLGVIAGLLFGVLYAAIVIHGLKTWWLGAISKPIIDLYVAPRALAIGAIGSLLVSFLTIWYSLRSSRKQTINDLLAGQLTPVANVGESQGVWKGRTMIGLLVGAVGLSIVASFLGGEPQAGAFMGAGFLILAAGLIGTYRFLGKNEDRAVNELSITRLAFMAGKRNPLRSTLTVGLVAFAAFLIIAVSSFRLSPTREGTAGFDLIATSERPVFEPLEQRASSPIESYSFRVKSGEDASCNNLYQSSQPKVLGVSSQFVGSFNNGESTLDSFRWSATSSTESGDRFENPWRLLEEDFSDGAIPVVIDKNTANYSLKIFAVGTDYRVEFDSGESVLFRVVGLLENSILQGSLIISEEHFVRQFPSLYGYRQFLIRHSQSQAGSNQQRSNLESRDSFIDNISTELEERYSDQGFDAESATALLAKFQQVQNTYISTFQTLGALGLLLGTFGLAVVQIRSVVERQKELGVMRSVGLSRGQLSWMVLLENAWLLGVGLFVGILAALVTTLPHFLIGGASVPWLDLGVLFVVIIAFGLAAAWIASRVIAKLPLLASLRSA